MKKEPCIVGGNVNQYSQYEVPPKTKNVCTTMYSAPLFTITNIWEQPKCLSNE